MKLITLTALLAITCAWLGLIYASYRQAQPVEWEHGYKTAHVLATRYQNKLGYNIGFQYPGKENNCDAASLFDFMAEHDGWVMQGGGYPGAEMFVMFKGVNDRNSANVKLREILPQLEMVARTL